jgi:hypothetical protein
LTIFRRGMRPPSGTELKSFAQWRLQNIGRPHSRRLHETSIPRICFATEPLGKRDLLWEPHNIAAFRVKPHSWGIKNISEIFLLFASVSNRTKRIWRLFRYGNNKNMMVG